MAWIEKDPRTGLYKVVLRRGDQKLKKSLKTRDQHEAQTLVRHY